MLDLRLTLAVAAILLAPLAAAQSPPEPPAESLEPAAEPPPEGGTGTDAEKLPEYEIEVIIFAHRDFNPSAEDFEHEREVAAAPSPDLPAVGLPASLVPQRPPGDATGLFPAEPASAGTVPANAYGPETGADRTHLDPMIYGDPFAAPRASGAAATPAGAGAESTDTATEPSAAPAESFHFRLLTPDELELDDLYTKIERLDAYRPLLHGGWVQPGLPPEAAHPFDLSLLGISNPRGTIELYLSRFLHLKVDLSYAPPENTAVGGDGSGAANPAFGTENSALGAGSSAFGAADSTLDAFALPPRYSLHAERRLRSGEIHYIDHPAFGVLVQIRPVPEPTPQEPPRPAA